MLFTIGNRVNSSYASIMKLQFTKMQGAGNDFIVLDGVSQSIDLSPAQYQQLADRHFGIGCDQILLVESSELPDVDFKYRIFNADGSEVEQCGNGARCFARFVSRNNLTDKSEITVATKNNIIILKLTGNGLVTVNMGQPKFQPADIPFNAPEMANRYKLLVEGESVEIGAVSMGNPHGIVLVKDVKEAPVQTLGQILEAHKSFPARANIGFMQIISKTEINLRVFERGSGETLACGSGACAAMVIGNKWGLLDEMVDVNLSGGSLNIQWDGNESDVNMTGPAEFVFDGEVTI